MAKVCHIPALLLRLLKKGYCERGEITWQVNTTESKVASLKQML